MVQEVTVQEATVPGRSGWQETWRVLAYTGAIALAFIALGRLQMAAVDWVVARGVPSLTGTAPDPALLPQAAEVAAASREAVARLPPGHRRAAWQMGLALGQVSQLVGSVARSDAAVQRQVAGLAQPHLQAAAGLAAQLGVAAEAPLPVRTLQDFAGLTQRIEDDENGAAARLQRQLSPLHRHLFLLGQHLGTEWARVQSTGGRISQPPARLIARHATLAGIPPALWQPLAQAPRDETPAQVLQRYGQGLDALAAALALPG